jgi:very-short-patch-repair endonuclease
MMTPIDFEKRTNSPPLQGRGRGWGLSATMLSELHDRAAQMRRNPTEPEKRLWRILSRSQLDGFKFRRQDVIGWFIADFMCPARSLIVEVDGDTHDEAKDRLRDDILGERGFRVLRVTNHDVMSNIEGVADAISRALSLNVACAESPHPNPSPKGEGLVEAQKLLGISLEGSVG